jgi:hypothetical protein
MLSSSGLTRAGQFLGTPDYAAPEQISGATVDGRADQYALACVAYTLLAGRVLFERDQAMATLYAHLFKPPPRVTKLRPDLPAAVDEVLARALAKEPRARYDSCGAFSDALRQALGLPPYGSAWLGRPSARPGSLRPAPSAAPPPSPGPIALETTVGAGGVPASAAAMISTASLTAPPDSPTSPPVPEALSPVSEAAPSRAPEAAPSPVPDAASRPAPPGHPVRPAAAGTWTAVVTADRAYYDSVQAEGTPDAASIAFPGHCPPRRFRAVRDRGPHRPTQRVPPHRAGDRPEGPAHRPGGITGARQADRRAGRKLVCRRPRLDERHARQRRRDHARRCGAVARRRPRQPRRLDHDHDDPGLSLVLCSQLVAVDLGQCPAGWSQRGRRRE